jgi:hypothetical protein
MKALTWWLATGAGWMMISSCQPLKHEDPLNGPGVMNAISPTSPMYNDAHAAEDFHLRRVRGSVGVDVASDF